MLLVMMNNHLYNETRARNMNGGGRLFEAGRDYNGYLGDPNVDFAKIAEAYGLRGEKVRTAGELVPALERACAACATARPCSSTSRSKKTGRLCPSHVVPAALDRRDPAQGEDRVMPTRNRRTRMNARRGVRRLAPICLALWMVVVWMAAGVEGTAMSPRVAGAAQACLHRS